jgi:hypothetical protein
MLVLMDQVGHNLSQAESEVLRAGGGGGGGGRGGGGEWQEADTEVESF